MPGSSTARRRARRGRLLGWAPVVGVVLALAGAGVVTAYDLSDADADAAARVDEHERRVDVGDEPDGSSVSLDVSIFTPPEGTPDAGAGGRAAVVLAHGFGGSKADLEERARGLAAEGYVVLTYTARGFGRSGGRIHLNAPDHEIDDVSAMVTLLAERGDVRRDGDGDPRVGVAGVSYGGAAALMSAGYDDRVDAVVAGATWHDLGQALFPQFAGRGGSVASPAAVEPIGTAGVFKQQWAAQLFASGLAGGPAGGALGGGAVAGDAGGGGDAGAPSGTSDEAVPCGRFAPDVCRLYARAATTGRPGPGALDRLRRSSPAPVTDRIDVPTLLIQGQQDSLFPLTAADANARGIAADGTPVGVRWIDGGHDAGLSSEGSFGGMTEAMSTWFDHHLRDGPDPGPGFSFTLPQSGRGGDAEPERRAAPSYPSEGRAGTERVALSGDPTRFISPPGGVPSAVTVLPGRGDMASIGTSGEALAKLPGQSATFRTSPFEGGHRVVGSPRVRLSVTSSTPEATLFVSLWVVTPDGSVTLPRGLVSPVRLTGLDPGRAREIEVALPASVYEVEKGERLQLVVSSTNAAYAVPDEARRYEVALAGDGVLRLPGVDAEPVADGPTLPLGLTAAVGVVVATALLAGLLLTRRRRGASATGFDDVPLAVEGLVKEYGDGVRAVDDVSWRAERGQVLGLLGPNGAGKTTTMRMLVGLVRPDHGRALVLGDEVRSGAPVLARVGALIEGPGFLPHLTGRENLLAYWAATGRPMAEACLDDVLDVAGLGTAVDRRVRTYSHGMRQRLGIAQAMLGLPELLLLDEPTNGLDPPQIRAFRSVLQDYAAGGRTVVVSSHLLAEVEQTCSHVVMMHRGRVVLDGAIEGLLPRTGSIVVTVAESTSSAEPTSPTKGGPDGPDTGSVDGAAALLRNTEGVAGVDLDAAGRLRVRGDIAVPDVIRTLIGAGFDVTSVDSRGHLEDVFMSLVGERETVS